MRDCRGLVDPIPRRASPTQVRLTGMLHFNLHKVPTHKNSCARSIKVDTARQVICHLLDQHDTTPTCHSNHHIYTHHFTCDKADSPCLYVATVLRTACHGAFACLSVPQCAFTGPCQANDGLCVQCLWLCACTCMWHVHGAHGSRSAVQCGMQWKRRRVVRGASWRDG